MKIALIIPGRDSESSTSFYEYGFVSKFLFSKKYFSYLLAAPTLASLTPPGHEVRIFDENVEEIDYGWNPDLAGITSMTMYATRAYQIADTFRSNGVMTVMGGIHPSMCPDEALQHCDSVVIGEAEEVWKELVQDAQNGGVKKRYKAEGYVNISDFPPADRSAVSGSRYFSDIIQTTRGCPFHCEFCSVHAFNGKKIRSKTARQVVDELRSMHNGNLRFKKKAVFFADDNIIANKRFSRELFSELSRDRVKWSCQASVNIAKDEEILRLMKESGCGSMLIGLESVSSENLSCMDKGVNLRHDYLDAIRTIQSHGIRVDGSFILGYDFDSPATFDELIAFIDKSKMLMPLINLLTPFPGTKLFKRFEEEGRILHRDWSRYDTKTVVFTHPTMTQSELESEFRRVIRHVYSFESIYNKLQYYWDMDFWKDLNREDPIAMKYRLLFAFRLFTLLFSPNIRRSRFILRIMPRVFQRKVRISTILSLMAYNDYAYSL